MVAVSGDWWERGWGFQLLVGNRFVCKLERNWGGGGGGPALCHHCYRRLRLIESRVGGLGVGRNTLGMDKIRDIILF